jgi:hypothetical protein
VWPPITSVRQSSKRQNRLLFAGALGHAVIHPSEGREPGVWPLGQAERVMPIRIHAAYRVVPDVSVQIERPRVAEDCVGNRRGTRVPVRGHEPSQIARIVARAKVVEAALRIALFSGVLVVLVGEGLRVGVAPLRKDNNPTRSESLR